MTNFLLGVASKVAFNWDIGINPSQSNVAFLIETSHLIRTEDQITVFYMIGINPVLKWVKVPVAKNK